MRRCTARQLHRSCAPPRERLPWINEITSPAKRSAEKRGLVCVRVAPTQAQDTVVKRCEHTNKVEHFRWCDPKCVRFTSFSM